MITKIDLEQRAREQFSNLFTDRSVVKMDRRSGDLVISRLKPTDLTPRRVIKVVVK